jgi:hypothetical protein
VGARPVGPVNYSGDPYDRVDAMSVAGTTNGLVIRLLS